MGNAIESADNTKSLRMRRIDFVADLLKMVLRDNSVEAIKAFGLFRILQSNVLPIINKVSLHNQGYSLPGILTRNTKIFIFANYIYFYILYVTTFANVRNTRYNNSIINKNDIVIIYNLLRIQFG